MRGEELQVNVWFYFCSHLISSHSFDSLFPVSTVKDISKWQLEDIFHTFHINSIIMTREVGASPGSPCLVDAQIWLIPASFMVGLGGRIRCFVCCNEIHRIKVNNDLWWSESTNCVCPASKEATTSLQCSTGTRSETTLGPHNSLILLVLTTPSLTGKTS